MITILNLNWAELILTTLSQIGDVNLSPDSHIHLPNYW